MALRIACQMDPIDRIDIRGDSTFALLLEAEARGHALFYYTPEALTLDDERLIATGHDVTVRDTVGDHVTVGPARTVDLATMDVVLLRQDPPFDMAYITTTHLLERIHPKTLVVNNPAEVRNAPEKIWVLDFQDLMPPTMVTRSLADIQAFRARHKDIIIKPLYGNGGAAVFRIKPDDSNLNALMEIFHLWSREPIMVQEFRPEVRLGDKRVILVDGEAVGAINRVPADGAQAPRADFCRHRRYWAVSDRDQRDVAHGNPAGEGVRWRGHRGADLGRDRAKAERVSARALPSRSRQRTSPLETRLKTGCRGPRLSWRSQAPLGCQGSLRGRILLNPHSAANLTC
jgi:glutathione synthase